MTIKQRNVEFPVDFLADSERQQDLLGLENRTPLLNKQHAWSNYGSLLDYKTSNTSWNLKNISKVNPKQHLGTFYWLSKSANKLLKWSRSNPQNRNCFFARNGSRQKNDWTGKRSHNNQVSSTVCSNCWTSHELTSCLSIG